MTKVRTKRKKTMKSASQSGRLRILLIGAFLMLFLSVCVGRVAYLQLFISEESTSEGRAQHYKDSTFVAQRGPILDRNGRIMAMTIPYQRLQVLRPSKHREFITDFISAVSHTPREEVWRRCGFDEEARLDTQKTPEQSTVFGEDGWLDWFQRKFRYAPVIMADVDPNVVRAISKIRQYKVPLKKDENRKMVPDVASADKEMLWLKEVLRSVRPLNSSRRIAPHMTLAAQVVGHTGVPDKAWTLREGRPAFSDELQGKSSVEAAVDRFIRSTRKTLRALKLKGGGLSLLADNPALNLEGPRAILTIDAELQRNVEDALALGVVEARATEGVALVMEIDTGNLAAVAQYPPFNPNAQSEYDRDEMYKWRNSAFVMAFEPGSTVKVLLDAAALEEGVLNEEDRIYCHGKDGWEVAAGEKKIKDTHPLGYASLREAIKDSSNVFHGKVALWRLGPELVYRYLRAFGFGERTNVLWDLMADSGRGSKPLEAPLEGMGLLHHWKKWRNYDTANIGRGHGFSVTPVELVAALAALGNGGVWRNPVLIERVVDVDGKVLREAPRVSRRVVSEEVARRIINLMVSVVEAGGTGEDAAIFGVSVAGKTGTAQKIIPVEFEVDTPEGGTRTVRRGHLSDDRYVASFVGLVPAEKPRYAILVLVDDPTGTHVGGRVAGPIFSSIAQRTLAYFRLKKGNVEEDETAVVEAVVTPEAAASSGEPMDALTDAGKRATGPARVPDFKGMSVARSLGLAWQSRLQLKAKGAGIAVKQNVAPGTLLEEGAPVEVTFSMEPRDG